MKNNLGLFIDGTRVNLFNDESISYTLKLIDIEKISNIFFDYTGTFNIPADDITNEVFKHYYDINIDNTFNANIRVPAYIELDSIPFKFGLIQLEGIKMKDNRPTSYSITFYSGVKQLTDLFGEDTIDKLDYVKDDNGVLVKTYNSLSQYDFLYNGPNFSSTLYNPNFKNGDLITPLIALADRDWELGGGTSLDILTNSGAVKDNEVRQALRLIKVIEAIETKYGITFSRDFFNTADFIDLFMWLNNIDDKEVFAYGEEIRLDTSTITNQHEPLGYYRNPDGTIEKRSDPTLIALLQYKYYLALTKPYVKVLDTLYLGFMGMIVIPNVASMSTWYKVIVYLDGVPLVEKICIGQNLIEFGSDIGTYDIRIAVSGDFTATFDLTSFQGKVNDGDSPSYEADKLAITTYSTQSFVKTMVVEKHIKPIKVTDLITNLMKMFKLIIRPTSQNSFYIDTLDNYYRKGNVYDITKYVDIENIQMNRYNIYKEIKFKYKKTNNVLSKRFREQFDNAYDEISYGDLRASYLSTSSNDALSVEVAFENMMFERFRIPNSSILSNVCIAQSVTVEKDFTIKKNNSDVVLFYNNGVVDVKDTPVRFHYLPSGTYFQSDYIYSIASCNNYIYRQVSNSLNFSSVIDGYHQTEISSSLYNNFWAEWINTIYNTKQRLIPINAVIPIEITQYIDLNDRIIISGDRYKISDLSIDLNTNECELLLFKDIYEYTDIRSSLNDYYNRAIDFIVLDWATPSDGDGSYLYGSFTTYDGQTRNYLVKTYKNGAIDGRFDVGTGFNNFLSINPSIGLYNNKLLLTGGFTTYKGTSVPYIVRLNLDGSLDTAFQTNLGTGANQRTNGFDITSDGKYYITGLFDSFNGNTNYNYIVKLNSNGTIDGTFAVGSGANAGFNGETYDVVVNSDNSIFVCGSFTKWKTTNHNHLIRIDSTGTRINSFTTGTGFNNTSGLRMVRFDGTLGKIVVYGDFTSYNGTAVNRIVRLNTNGTIDTSFYQGTGFNGSVREIKKTPDNTYFITGTFTTYNGISSHNAIILDTNGFILRTFRTGYSSHFYNFPYIYGKNNATGQIERLEDEYDLGISNQNIVNNPGNKHIDVLIYSKSDITLTKITKGFGTTWVNINKLYIGNNFYKITIEILEKVTDPIPAVYQPRVMLIEVQNDLTKSYINILQHGLIAP